MEVTRAGSSATALTESEQSSSTQPSVVGPPRPPSPASSADVCVEAHPEARGASFAAQAHDGGEGTVSAAALSAVGARGLQVTADSMGPELKRAIGNTDGLFAMMGPKADVARALTLLEQLPPSEFKKAIEGLSGKERAKLFTQMSAAQRSEVLHLAQGKGYVEATPAGKAEPAAGAPPGNPEMFRNDARLPPEVRQAIHEQNTASVQQYQRDFKGYVERYASGLGQVKSKDELRQMGPPHKPCGDLNEPGVMGDDLKKFPNTSRHFSASLLPAYRAVNDRVCQLEGRPVGNFSLVAEAEIEVQLSTHVFGLKSNVAVDGSGAVDVANVGERGRALGPLKATRDTRGKTELEAEHEGTGLKAKFDQRGQLEEVGAMVHHTGLEWDREGKLTLKSEYAEVVADPKNATLTTSVKAEGDADLGVAKVKGSMKFGVSARGLSKQDARNLVTDEGSVFK